MEWESWPTTPTAAAADRHEAATRSIAKPRQTTSANGRIRPPERPSHTHLRKHQCRSRSADAHSRAPRHKQERPIAPTLAAEQPPRTRLPGSMRLEKSGWWMETKQEELFGDRRA